MVDRLIDTLRREADLFESFLNLLEQQQSMLVRNDREGLRRLTGLQRERLAESRILAGQREQLIERIKAANEITGDLTVSRLLDIVDRDRASQLSELRALILSLTDKITRTRNRNALLLNRSREYIAKTMEMLARVRNPGSGYAAAGGDGAVGGNVAVDRRV